MERYDVAAYQWRLISIEQCVRPSNCKIMNIWHQRQIKIGAGGLERGGLIFKKVPGAILNVYIMFVFENLVQIGSEAFEFIILHYSASLG